MALKGLQTADQVIRSVLFRIEDYDLLKYQIGVDYFIDIYRDANLFFVNQTRDKIIDVSAIGVARLPDDYVDYVKVGVPIGGEIFTFTKRGDVIRLDTDPLGVSVDEDMGEGQDLDISYTPSMATGMFNDQGYFDIDIPNNRILVRNTDATRIILRYVSTGIEDMETTYIPAQAINYVKAELEYRLELKNANLTNGVKSLLKMKTDEEMSKLDTINMPTLDELIDSIYETSGRGARRW